MVGKINRAWFMTAAKYLLVWTLCAPTVCQVLIVSQCCMDVVRSIDEMYAYVVQTAICKFLD